MEQVCLDINGKKIQVSVGGSGTDRRKVRMQYRGLRRL